MVRKARAEARWASAVGRRLRELRRERGLTQERLAEAADVHPGFVQKIEAGRRLPSLQTLTRLARGLDVPVSAIVGVLDDAPAGDNGDELASTHALLRTCTPRQLALVRDFVRLLCSHRWDG